MANALLNSAVITNTALAILHQKLNFIGSINRAYDDSFGVEGAKIGSSLRIRKPNRYTVRSGPTLSTQDVIEDQVVLNVTSQKGVDVNFTSVELTLNIDDFAKRIIEPAMTVLAANIEADALNMALDVYNQVNGQGSPQVFRNVLQARKVLRDNLAPTGEYLMRLNTQDNVDLVDSLKGLFQSSTNISKQYLDGVMGQTAGFEFAENTFLTTFARGTGAGYLVNGAGQVGNILAVGTGTGGGNVGDVFTIGGVFRVHPETRNSTNTLQQFVLTAPYTAGGATMTFAPAIVVSGPLQNVALGPASGAAVVFAGAVGGVSGISLGYAKDAFTFATADLVMPSGVDMAARKEMDGLSLRLVRQYDINNDRFPCRLDILYGYKTIRPELACRLLAN